MMLENFPFTQDASAGIGSLGEVALLKKIADWLKPFPRVARPSPRGIGDDCAVFPSEHGDTARLVTMDSVIFSKHFDASVSPQNAGAKLIKRNASDIAAMGGKPGDAVLSLVMSRDVKTEWLAEFYAGTAHACDALGIELAGGDLASAPEGTQIFIATLSLTGFSENLPLLRSGAQIGDAIFVTGTLGGSISRKHFAFTPRLAEGQFLASFPREKIRACMDITDGLAKDLKEIVPANAHVEFDFAAIPVSEEAQKLAGGNRELELVHAFCDGEDYELFFCVAPDFEAEFKTLWRERFPATRLTRIGRIAPGAAPFPRFSENASGYEHFGNASRS